MIIRDCLLISIINGKGKVYLNAINQKNNKILNINQYNFDTFFDAGFKQ